MRPCFQVWKIATFAERRGERPKKTGQLLSYRNHPGFLGFYGRLPLTRVWMLTIGVATDYD